ncbi:MAG: methionyl-tRNA formyltransferase [Lachnospiraceae bacterium]|nr:methionyl-tRNA formyltransferase [Lachnospiraceae bacterium]
MRIVYMGTPDIAAVILKRLIGEPYKIVLAVTQPDRPKGRGKELAKSPVKLVAEEAGIPVFQPLKLRDPEAVKAVAKAKPDMIVVAAFGQILPKAVLDLPKYGCINVHASLLPAYRGAAPIQWSIIDGQRETGITIMKMDEGLDTGDILLQKSIAISPEETGGSLHDRLAELGADALVEAIPGVIDGSLKPVPQGEMTTPYAKQLTKEMGRLDFTKSAEELARTVRGLDPWPGTYTDLDGKLLKIWKAEPVILQNTGMAPGTITDITKKSFTYVTAVGGLRITELQPEGKRRMTTEEFLRGYHFPER